MKAKSVVAFLVLVMLVAFYGCEKNLLEPGEVSDSVAIKELVEDNSELFNAMGIDDDGAQEMSYEAGLSKWSKSAESIIPLRFGRRGHFRLVSIDVEFSADNDTAWANIVRSFNGTFIVIAEDTTTSPPSAQIYEKSMSNIITRKAIFVRVANTRNPRRNWRLRGVTMCEGYSDPCTITINDLQIVTPDTEYVVDNPLEYWIWGRTTNEDVSLPTVSPGDTVKIYLTLTNTNENPPEPGETVLLHYGTNHRSRRARRPFNDEGIYPDEVAGDGVYSGFWVVHQHRGIYHAHFDVIDNGTIYDDVLPYDSAVWGIPYLVK